MRDGICGMNRCGMEPCACAESRAAECRPSPAGEDAMREERNELYGYVQGLLGLLQLVRSRDDMPAAIADVLRTNHRAVDAAAYLTQIVPRTLSAAPGGVPDGWRRGFEAAIHAADHCEPEFIQQLANESETFVADKMRYAIVCRLREALAASAKVP